MVNKQRQSTHDTEFQVSLIAIIHKLIKILTLLDDLLTIIS